MTHTPWTDYLLCYKYMLLLVMYKLNGYSGDTEYERNGSLYMLTCVLSEHRLTRLKSHTVNMLNVKLN